MKGKVYPLLKTTAAGRVETRDATDNAPPRLEGLAVPYNTEVFADGAYELFRYGAFRDAVAEVEAGKRIAYLTRHGKNGGVVAATINHLREERDGLHFRADMLDVSAAAETRSVIAAGIDGVSIEFVPDKYIERHGIRQHTGGVRLAAIAGSYAPAYRSARVALRDVGGTRRMRNLSLEALRERQAAINTEITTLRQTAATEDRSLSEDEQEDLEALQGRKTNVEALISTAEADAKRRDAERSSLPQENANEGRRSPAVVVREEPIYGRDASISYFRDLLYMRDDSEAAERMRRHRAMVTDIADQINNRAVESGELVGSFPAQNFPDLYVPDIAKNGPLAAFFASTPLTSPAPITVPAFATVTGDTGVQATENTALANVDVTTAPRTLTPKTIGGETIVSRQAVDGASPGIDTIIRTQLDELLMRDKEREIAAVLEAITSSGAIADTAGTTPAASGRDLLKGYQTILGQFFAGAAAGGAGARFLPAEGIFPNSTDWGNLVAAEDTQGRPLMAYINPVNANAETGNAPGFQSGIVGGVPITPAWAILSATNHVVARRNDARQWLSSVMNFTLGERNGPQSIVYAVMQYFGFAVLEPVGVRRYTYTNV